MMGRATSRCGAFLAALLLAGCAALDVMPPRTPEAKPVPPPPSVAAPQPAPGPAPSAVPPAHVRYFPDFVAVIVQPGDTLPSLAARYLGDPALDWRIAEFNGISALKPGDG